MLYIHEYTKISRIYYARQITDMNTMKMFDYRSIIQSPKVYT